MQPSFVQFPSRCSNTPGLAQALSLELASLFNLTLDYSFKYSYRRDRYAEGFLRLIMYCQNSLKNWIL